MDPVSAIALFLLGIFALCQYGHRLKIQSDFENLRAELEQLLSDIEKSKIDNKFSSPMPRTKLARSIFREYLKLFLENNLNKRLNNTAGRFSSTKIHESKFLIPKKNGIKN